MRRIAAFCIAHAVALTCAFGSTAKAHGAEAATETTRREAKATADAGADAYARGSFAQAHELFVKAYGLVPAPTIALFEARALMQMKRLVEARAAYERASSTALAVGAPDAFRQAVSDARAELVALDRRIPRYRVVVDERSLHAVRHRVFVDGQLLPQSSVGAWILADPGVHELRLGEARDASRERFELREGETKSVRIDASSTTDPLRTWGFVSLGVGAAGLAVGVSAGLVALDAHRDAERRCPNETCLRGSPGAAALERFEDYRTISTVGYALGAVGVATGTLLVLGSSDESKPRVAVTSSLRHVSLETSF
jgi:hypothetical protein